MDPVIVGILGWKLRVCSPGPNLASSLTGCISQCGGEGDEGEGSRLVKRFVLARRSEPERLQIPFVRIYAP